VTEAKLMEAGWILAGAAARVLFSHASTSRESV
jgi:hypothetical protein